MFQWSMPPKAKVNAKAKETKAQKTATPKEVDVATEQLDDLPRHLAQREAALGDKISDKIQEHNALREDLHQKERDPLRGRMMTRRAPSSRRIYLP